MKEQENKFDVIFFGLKSDTQASREEFIKKLSETHRMPLEKFAFLKEKTNVILYSNIDRQVAEKTVKWLEMLGAVVQVESHREQKKEKLAFRKCPSCGGFNKVDSVRCAMCNFDFRSVHQTSEPAEGQAKSTTESHQVALAANVFASSASPKPSKKTGTPEYLNPAGVDFKTFTSEAETEEPKDPTMPIDVRSGTISPYSLPRTFIPAESSAHQRKEQPDKKKK